VFPTVLAWVWPLVLGFHLSGLGGWPLGAQPLVQLIGPTGASPAALVAADYHHQCLSDTQQGQFARAVAVCQQAMDQAPAALDPCLGLGVAHYQTQRYTQALATLQHCLTIRTDYRGLYNRGLVRLAMGRPQAARQDFDQALALAPSVDIQAVIHTDRGLAHLANHHPEAAWADLSEALALDETNVRALFNRGCLCHQLGQFEQAMADFDRLLRLDATNPHAYLGRGLLRHDLGDRAGSLADLQQGATHARHQHDTQLCRHILTLLHQLQQPAVAVG